MNEDTQNEIWVKENGLLEKLKLENPDDFKIPKKNQIDLLEHIGILGKEKNLPSGTIKLFPSDFIVEEIQEDGTIIEVTKTVDQNDKEGDTTYAELVKINQSTTDCIREISKILKIKSDQIGYAGMKDTAALTSQLISIRGSKIEEIKKIQHNSFFLKNIRKGKGVVSVGKLKGNRFSILIRTRGLVDEKKMVEKIERIKQHGLINFYGPQRFGSPRYIGHILGREIFKGDVDNLLNLVVSKESDFEYPYFTKIRRKIKNLSNLKDIESEIRHLPYTFQYPLEIINSILKDGYDKSKENFIQTRKDQINLWSKAYASYIANIILSKMEMGEIKEQEKLSLLLSKENNDFELYRSYLKNDDTMFFRKNIQESFRSLYLISNNASIPTRIQPKNINYRIEDCGVYISFELEKGAYATTFLMEIFDIFSEKDTSELNQEIFDTKEKLALESIKEIFSKFEMKKTA